MNNEIEPSRAVRTPESDLDFSRDNHLATELKWQQVTTDLLESLQPYQRSILGILAISDRQQIDPTPLLINLGCELPGRTAYDTINFAKHLASELASDHEVLKSLERYPRLISPEALVLLKLAEEESMLKHIFSLIQRRIPRSYRFQRSNYVVGMGLLLKTQFILAIIGFLCLKVVPELLKINEEFGMNNDRSLLISQYMESFVQWLGGFVSILFLIVAFIFIVRFIRFLFGLSPWLKMSTSRPVTRSRFLASLTQATHSIAHGIERMAHVGPIKRLFPSILKVERRIQQGEEPWKALSNQGIISQSDAALISSVSPETQAWLLRWKAANQERNHDFRVATGRRIFWLVIQIGLVVVVFLASMLVFGFLVDLLNNFSQA